MKAKIRVLLGVVATIRCVISGVGYMLQIYTVSTTFDFWFTVVAMVSAIICIAKR